MAGTVVLRPLYQKAGGDITDERSILPLSVLLSVSLPLHILPREGSPLVRCIVRLRNKRRNQVANRGGIVAHATVCGVKGVQ